MRETRRKDCIDPRRAEAAPQILVVCLSGSILKTQVGSTSSCGRHAHSGCERMLCLYYLVVKEINSCSDQVNVDGLRHPKIDTHTVNCVFEVRLQEGVLSQTVCKLLSHEVCGLRSGLKERQSANVRDSKTGVVPNTGN